MTCESALRDAEYCEAVAEQPCVANATCTYEACAAESELIYWCQEKPPANSIFVAMEHDMPVYVQPPSSPDGGLEVPVLRLVLWV